MENYEKQVELELQIWKLEVMKAPSSFGNITAKIQGTINSYIPQKVHNAITITIKKMMKAVLFGSQITSSSRPPEAMSLIHREALVKAKIDSFVKLAQPKVPLRAQVVF